MNQPTSLTRHPEGSIRELWSISMPLMISTLASLFMIFTDRIFLAHYSLAAMNASVTAGTLAWALMSGIGMITAMSEIFVAQYNGAKQYHRLGVPVWQMIWFSFFSLAFFIPVAIWGAPLFFQTNLYRTRSNKNLGLACNRSEHHQHRSRSSFDFWHSRMDSGNGRPRRCDRYLFWLFIRSQHACLFISRSRKPQALWNRIL